MEQLRFAPRAASDEIDLFDLFQMVWEQRITLLGTMAAVIALAVGYAFLATPHYQVQGVIKPAHIRDLDAINQSGLYSLSPEGALRRVGAALESYEVRLGFFREHPELFESIRQPGHTLEQSFEQFNKDAFRILQPKAEEDESLSGFVGLQLTYPRGLDGVTVTNLLMDYAEELQRAVIAEDLEILVQNRLNELERRIAGARAAYETRKQTEIAQLMEADRLRKAQLEDELSALRGQLRTRRQNRIQQLDEAIQIAGELGLVKPTTPSALGEMARPGQGSVVLTEVNNRQIPLYFMGTETLEAERSALQQRSSDDFVEPRIAEIAKELQLLENNRRIEQLQQREQEDLFLSRIADWREEEARLKSLKLDLSAVNLVRRDQRAVPPLQAVKPRKALVLALSAVLGGMLGLLVALVRSAVQRRTAETLEVSKRGRSNLDEVAAT